jgi:hypothetical protein
MNAQVLKLLKAVGLEKKANEVMGTSNTGYGAEFVPDEVFAKEILDIRTNRPGFLPLLRGFHGSGLPKTLTVPVIGLSVGDQEFDGKSEWNTGTASQTEDDHTVSKAPTQQVQLVQKGFIAEVNISDDQLAYNAANTEEYVKNRLREGVALTVEKLIVNGDTTNAATGNVNSDDADPADSKYYLKADGAIKKALAGSYDVNIGTLDYDDYAALLGKMGEYATNPDDVLFLQSIKVTLKALQISSFLTVQNSGDRATIQSGLRPTPFGSDMFTTRAVGLAEADGKQSATSSNNTLGRIVAMHKAAAQFGFGQDMKIEVVRVPGYGWRIVCSFDLGLNFVDAGTGLTDATVALGRNITV